MARSDVLVPFDIRRYQQSLMRLAEAAAKRRVTVVLFTEQWLSPISRIARHIVAAPTSVPSAWDSTTALLVLVEVLLNKITENSAPASVKRIRQVERTGPAGKPEEEAGCVLRQQSASLSHAQNEDGLAMALSVFDIFKIGIGPSSSHTVGPMKAARRFALQLESDGHLATTARVGVQLCGSLGHTGRGHGSDRAILLGLLGEQPETVDPDAVERLLESIRKDGLYLLGRHRVAFDPRRDLVFHKRRQMPEHPNGMRFEAIDADGALLASRDYYSVGGGFVLEPDETRGSRIVADTTMVAHPFASAVDLLELCRVHATGLATIVRANERAWRSDEQIDRGLLELWDTMQACAARGIATEGELPGGLHVPRRAPALHRHLLATHGNPPTDPLAILDWIDLYALAVNEENAAGGRVITAPTNGAAGVIPAVLHYYARFMPTADERGVIDFLLTAGAIGMLYKENASISGADVGCQGEVGVACSMAAGALAAVLGGTPAQVENAAEIGMEHNLGLTCDPVAGLVQIPCIERNAMAAVKAINAARIALRGNGSHRVSLDRVIRTMLATGRDMKDKYKETSRGGLAVNLIEC